MPFQKFKAKSESMLNWYQNIVVRADLVADISVRGSYVVQPYGLQILNEIQAQLKARLHPLNYREIRLPSFIPARSLELIDRFPEGSLVVTLANGHALVDPLILRQTNDVLIGRAFSKLDSGYQDLPMRLYHWANVFRLEDVTIPFVSAWETLLLEAYTFHKGAEEAINEISAIGVLLKQFCCEVAALPTLSGTLSSLHRFPGATQSYGLIARPTPNSVMKFGALHFLEQRFSTEFGITFQISKNREEHSWTTSWVLSEALLAATLITHGDDKGLVLPPKLAPIQIMIIPIYHSSEVEVASLNLSQEVKEKLTEAGLRVAIDNRTNVSAGYKFNDWEMRGVPLRIEIGEKELRDNSLTFVRRDGQDRVSASKEATLSMTTTMLEQLHDRMLGTAQIIAGAENDEPIIDNYPEFCSSIKDNWIQSHFCGNSECEREIANETGAIICFSTPEGEMSVHRCIRCQKMAQYLATFALTCL